MRQLCTRNWMFGVFHKFYRINSDELEKFGTTLKELRPSVWLQVLIEHILLNYIYISDMYVIMLIFMLIFLLHFQLWYL